MDKKIWEKGLKDELNFWDRWFATQGSEWPGDYEFRMREDTCLQSYLTDIIIEKKIFRPYILDVASGPLTMLGKTLMGETLHICAVDALGNEYIKLHRKYGIKPIIPVHQLEIERAFDSISKPCFVEHSTFDIVHCCNGLDHSYDPVKALENIIKLTRRKGFIYLIHTINEGEKENYSGLHSWNFFEDNGDFIISGRKKISINITSIFSLIATINTVTREDKIINIIFRK